MTGVQTCALPILADGTDDAEYLKAQERALEAAFARFQPQLIAYVAGADPYEQDKLGGLITPR